jgi:amino acid transporter
MDKPNIESSGKRFGAFGGVFTPSLLTILGVILFLRAGWVVGNVGLLGAILIIILSHIISVSTALSLSAIATSMKVKAGGNYYMISRTLGLEIGGSIGIPLYLSQALSLAFYTIGFTEGLRWVFPGLNPVSVASVTCITLTVIAVISADWAIKIQYVILAILGLSLVSFFSSRTGSHHFITFFKKSDIGFWSVFAVYFPAVTGLEVGVSMSGDLKNPERDIPTGTLWAIGVTFLIYLTQAGWLALNVPENQLMQDLMIMKTMSRWPFLIFAGLWAATLSSGLGSILAAPRTMQALAHDRILPKFCGQGSSEANEPRIATLITFLIAESCILMGGLDVVAPIITMFFLNTYGVVNLIAALENLTGNPSYRPTFKVHWLISVVGAAGCYLTMFLIHAPATGVSLLITLSIFIYLGRKDLRTTWGDVRYGAWYSLVRFAILKLEYAKRHPRNWRPNVIVFSGNPDTRRQLIELANWLEKGKGIITLYQFILGEEKKVIQHRKPALQLLRNFIQENNLPVLGQVHLAPSLRKGIKEVAQAHGLGPLRSNLVLIGWCQEQYREIEFAYILRELYEQEKSILVLNIPEEKAFGRQKRITIWWGGMENNGNLMLLIAHILSRNPGWEGCDINLNMIIKNEEGRASAQTNLENILQKARLDFQVNVIVQKSAEIKIPYIIREHSQDADLVILGMSIPEEGKEEEFMQRMQLFLAGLPTTLLVKNAEEIELIPE